MIAVTGGLLLMGTTHPDSAWTVLLPGFIVCGLGIGAVNPVLASGAISVVQPQRSGMASGANNTFRQVGIATGIAVLGAVFQSQIVAHTSAVLNKTIYGHEVLQRGGAQLPAVRSRPVRCSRWPPRSPSSPHATRARTPITPGSRARSTT